VKGERLDGSLDSLDGADAVPRIQGMKRNAQHPLVKALADKCRSDGAAVYAGKSFAVIRFDKESRLEIRVDSKKSNRSR
jgi:hypothetical protein